MADYDDWNDPPVVEKDYSEKSNFRKNDRPRGGGGRWRNNDCNRNDSYNDGGNWRGGGPRNNSEFSDNRRGGGGRNSWRDENEDNGFRDGGWSRKTNSDFSNSRGSGGDRNFRQREDNYDGWGTGDANCKRGSDVESDNEEVQRYSRGRGPRGGAGSGRRFNSRGDSQFSRESRAGPGSTSEDNWGSGDKKGGEDGEETKPRERYIPPEPTNDENEIFGGGITSGINFSNYNSIEVNVTGEDVPHPINSFEECNLNPVLLDNILRSGYQTPTPVQKHALPTILAGRDLMACAQTGSGKTAAFLIPIINNLLKLELSPQDRFCIDPYVIIMSPTRELSIQIFEEARKFSFRTSLKTCIVYGGTEVYYQKSQLSRGCHILVATPGRLKQFVNERKITFSSVKFFVLDEADRMLDMGFMPDIEHLLSHESMTPTGTRQTLMFSATFPKSIQRLAGSFLSNYLFLAVGIVGGACADVEQTIYEVQKYEKKEKLLEVLNSSRVSQELTLVFVEQKRTADFIAAFLSESEFPTTSIHGDRLQSQREQALRDFKSGRMPTLVATAVAARGLDIKNVAHVINYDMPSTIEEYVHRIGRTGRVGNRGRATSFFDPSQNVSLAEDLIRILRQSEQVIPPFLGESTSEPFNRKGTSFGGLDVRKMGGDFAPSSTAPSDPIEEEEEW